MVTASPLTLVPSRSRATKTSPVSIPSFASTFAAFSVARAARTARRESSSFAIGHTEDGHRELPDALDRSAMVFDRGFHGVVKPPRRR